MFARTPSINGLDWVLLGYMEHDEDVQANHVPEAFLLGDWIYLTYGGQVKGDYKYDRIRMKRRRVSRSELRHLESLCGDAQGPDLAGGHPGAFERPADGGTQGPLPQPRVLFGPSRSRIVGRVALGGAAEDAKVVRGRDRGLQALRADIDADDGDGPPPLVSGRQAAAMRIS